MILKRLIKKSKLRKLFSQITYFSLRCACQFLSVPGQKSHTSLWVGALKTPNFSPISSGPAKVCRKNCIIIAFFFHICRSICCRPEVAWSKGTPGYMFCHRPCMGPLRWQFDNSNTASWGSASVDVTDWNLCWFISDSAGYLFIDV